MSTATSSEPSAPADAEEDTVDAFVVEPVSGQRKRDPVYVVLVEREVEVVIERLTEVEVDPDHPATGTSTAARENVLTQPMTVWALIAENEHAKTDKAAIEQAADRLQLDVAEHRFWAPLASVYRPRESEQETKTITRWK